MDVKLPLLNEKTPGFKIDYLQSESDICLLLNESDLDQICALENDIWIPGLRASRKVISTRLQIGHKILAVKQQSEYAGMIGWRYDPFFNLDDDEEFPKDFYCFSMKESYDLSKARSAFIYNVGIKPVWRNKGIGSVMLQNALRYIRHEGIYQIFLDSRMPSYNGSKLYTNEQINQNLLFKQIVDKCLLNKTVPNLSEGYLDPTVRFYLFNGFKPWRIFKNFISDESSGDLRLICTQYLTV